MLSLHRGRAGRRGLWFVISAGLVIASPKWLHAADCPAAKDLPQLTIRDITESTVPVIDRWQVFFDDAPLSDAQLAALAKDDILLAELDAGMNRRPTWVYIGMGLGAGGTALSSVGWVLYGQDRISQGVTLPMALGGVLLGIAGVLMVTESIQRPLEPFTAPTPEHRLSRQEARELVAIVNRRLYIDICAAAQARPTSSAEVAD